MKLGRFKKLVQRFSPTNSLPHDASKDALHDALLSEHQIRLSLEKALSEKEAEFDIILKDRVRELSAANIQLSEQIALRKKISDALVKSQTRLTQAMSATRLGLIDWDVLHGQFYQSEFIDVFGPKEQSTEENAETGDSPGGLCPCQKYIKRLSGRTFIRLHYPVPRISR